MFLEVRRFQSFELTFLTLQIHLKAKQHDDRQAQVARIESFDDVAQSWETWKEQERANR